MKDIKPGVLSKIFLLAELKPEEIEDNDMQKLCIACKGVQTDLLEFANNKPMFTKKLKKGGMLGFLPEDINLR